jgi:hypothetical protein
MPAFIGERALRRAQQTTMMPALRLVVVFMIRSFLPVCAGDAGVRVACPVAACPQQTTMMRPALTFVVVFMRGSFRCNGRKARPKSITTHP